MAVRTCAVTRQEGGKDDLVRLVASPDGDVVVDYHGRLPGRGVWITPTAAVLAALPKHAARIGQQLGARCDAGAVNESLRAAVDRAVLDGLSMAAAAGSLVLGADVLEAALREGRIGLVAVASDAAERTARNLQTAGPEAAFVQIHADVATVGRRVGRDRVAAVGVPVAGPASYLRTQLRRLSDLG